MSHKKPYVPPRLTEYDQKDVPELVKLLKEERLSAHVSPAPVSPAYTIVVDQDRKYIEVSDSFSKLVGYKTEELLVSSTAFADQILQRIEFCFYPVCESSDVANGLLKLSDLTRGCILCEPNPGSLECAPKQQT